MDLPQIENIGLVTDGPLRVDQIAARLNQSGMVHLVGAVTPEVLASAQLEVAEYVRRHGPGDHDLLDHTRWECPTVEQIATSERVENLLNSLASPGERVGYSRRVLRIHDGTGVNRSKYAWHYDLSTLTLHIPITIPGDGTGDLAAFPARRPHVRTAVTSIREVFHPPALWAEKHFAAEPLRRTVRLIPGDAYIFHGHRTLHTGLPWPEGSLRANLILHYGYPQETAALRMAHTVRQVLDKFRRQSREGELVR